VSLPAWAAKPLPAREPAAVEFRAIRRLMLDPGHGGSNLGSLGLLGTREKALTLDYCRHIAAWLRAHSNLDVRLTRDGDTSLTLPERAKLANDAKADAFISLHFNAHELPEANGMEVFFLAAATSLQSTKALIEREEGIEAGQPTAHLPWSVTAIVRDLDLTAAHRASEHLATGLASGLKRARPGVRFRGVKQAPFGVLREAAMAAVVLEVGYLTNPKEVEVLLDPGTPASFGRAIQMALLELDRKRTAARKVSD
jgi:N-acetylmuramoyl-L-alanine amidase